MAEDFGRMFVDFALMVQVNRWFRSFIYNSPALHHRRELFATGLIDNPRCPCGAAERRQLREGYTHKWFNAGDLVKHTRKLPALQPLDWGSGFNAEYFGNGYFIADESDNGLFVLHIPPLASSKSIEGWRIPSFPFEIYTYAAYPPKNVIAVTEEGGG